MNFRRLGHGLVVVFGLGAPAMGDIITLRNGDRIRGAVIGEQDGLLKLQPSAANGVLELPIGEIKTIRREATKAPSQTVPAAAASAPAVAASSAVPAPPPAIVETAPPVSSVPPKPSPWKLPNGWKGNFALGYSETSGAVDSKESATEAKLAWADKKTTAEWEANYKYREQEAKKSADRYAVGQKLRHEGEKGFFVQSRTAAEVDNINKQRNEYSQVTGLGYSPLKSDKLSLRVSPGLEVEHVSAAAEEKANGTRYKANVQQEANWKVNDKVSLGQGATYAVDPRRDENWDLTAQAHLETKLGDNSKLRLNYKREKANGLKGKVDKKNGEFGASVVWDF